MDRALRANTLIAHRLLWLAEPPYRSPGGAQGTAAAGVLHRRARHRRPRCARRCAAEVGIDRDGRPVPRQRRRHGRGPRRCWSKRTSRDHGRADIRHRSPVGGAGRPRHRGVRARAPPFAAKARTSRAAHEARGDDAVPADAARVDAGVNADRIVLVHGFTQTASSCDRPSRDYAEPRSRRRRSGARRPGPRRPGDVRPTSRRRDAGRRGRRATYVGYSMGGGCACISPSLSPHVVDRLVLIGTTPGSRTIGERAARRAADEALADRSSESELPRSSNGGCAAAVRRSRPHGRRRPGPPRPTPPPASPRAAARRHRTQTPCGRGSAS